MLHRAEGRMMFCGKFVARGRTILVAIATSALSLLALHAFAEERETTRYQIGTKTLVVGPSETCDGECLKASIDGKTLMDEGYVLVAPRYRYSEPGFDAI